jgi:hypothetical protein
MPVTEWLPNSAPFPEICPTIPSITGSIGPINGRFLLKIRPASACLGREFSSRWLLARPKPASPTMAQDENRRTGIRLPKSHFSPGPPLAGPGLSSAGSSSTGPGRGRRPRQASSATSTGQPGQPSPAKEHRRPANQADRGKPTCRRLTDSSWTNSGKAASAHSHPASALGRWPQQPQASAPAQPRLLADASKLDDTRAQLSPGGSPDSRPADQLAGEVPSSTSPTRAATPHTPASAASAHSHWPG